MRVAVFDFDDTLLCTTHLKSAPISGLAKNALTTSITKLLFTAHYHCDLVLVLTLSESPWIEQCFSEIIPGCGELRNIIDFVTRDQVPLSLNPYEWKTDLFKAKLTPLFQREDSKENRHELISIGDSLFDREACLAVERLFPNVVVKSVKLVDLPTLDQVFRQQNALSKLFPRIVSFPQRLDCVLSCTQEQYALLSVISVQILPDTDEHKEDS